MRTYDRLPRSDLEAVQRVKLRALGDRLRNNAFYRTVHGALPDPLTPAALASLAPIDKDSLLADQRRYPPFGHRLAIDPVDVAMVHTTGGTSGRGREIHALTWRDVEAAGHLGSFAFWWAGLDFREPATFHIGFSNATGGNAMLRSIQAIGHTPILVGHVGFAERLELMRQYKPVGMYASPSAINGLAQLAGEQGLDLRREIPSLRFMLTSAEPYPVDWAVAMEDVWGARIFEDYGATQTASSIAASSCEQGAVTAGGRGCMHLFDWSFLFEVVDPDTLEPVEPGEYGELLITTLDKDASPLLRYRTRDRVRYLGWEGCPCGRQLMRLECGSITRYDDMLKIKGQNVFPADMEALVLAHAGIREFRGRVLIGERGRDELVLEIACRTDIDKAALEADLKHEFKQSVNITPRISFVEVESLPQWHTPEAKARRFLDQRSDDLVTRVMSGVKDG